MKPRPNCLASILSVMSGRNLTPSIPSIPTVKHHAVGVYFSGRDRVTGQGWGRADRSRVEISLMKTWSRALRTSDWAEGSPSNRTMTLSTRPRQRRSALGKTLWMSLSGPARALTWTQSNIFGETWKWLSTDSPHPTWQSNGRKIPKPRCAKLVSYPRRLKSVIAAKGASTKYWVKGLNTSVNVICQFSFLIHSTAFLKSCSCFVISGYRLMRGEINLSKRLQHTKMWKNQRVCKLSECTKCWYVSLLLCVCVSAFCVGGVCACVQLESRLSLFLF